MTLFQHPLHPLTVHFPIALYILGVFFTLIYLWRKQPEIEQFAYWCFILSWVAAMPASIFGLIDQNQLDVNDPRQVTVNNHITAGIALIIFNGLVVYMRFRRPNVLTRYRWVYLGLMLLGLAAVLTTGWLGGKLVYQLHVGIS